jgi:hypothetical protein
MVIEKPSEVNWAPQFRTFQRYGKLLIFTWAAMQGLLATVFASPPAANLWMLTQKLTSGPIGFGAEYAMNDVSIQFSIDNRCTPADVSLPSAPDPGMSTAMSDNTRLHQQHQAQEKLHQG